MQDRARAPRAGSAHRAPATPHRIDARGPLRRTDAGARARTAPREAEADRLGGGEHTAAPARPLGSRGGGAPLPTPLRAELEATTGADLGSVRVHDGPGAHREARAHHARAFARGDDLVFGAGRFQPQTSEGRALIAHEVGHVVQQRREGAARVDRAEPTPEEVFLEATRPLLRQAMESAITSEDQTFWDLLVTNGELGDKLLERASDVAEADEDAFLSSFDWAVQRLDEITGTIVLADNVDDEIVNWDDTIVLLGKQLGSTALSSYGLPTSFGTDLFLEYAADNLVPYITDMAQVLVDAYAAFDPATATGSLQEALDKAVTDNFEIQKPILTGALESGIATFGDPFGLLELELEGAISQLWTLRKNFASAPPGPERAAVGKQLNYVARLILAIDKHLVGVEERVERRAAEERVEAIGAADDGEVSELVAGARVAAETEEGTLIHRGNKRSELKLHTVDIDSPLYAGGGSSPIAQEEAYPEFTDQVTFDALTTLADQASAEAAEVERLHKEIVPERVTDLVQFAAVYKRWFGFYSSQARAYDPSFELLNKLYKSGIMSLAAMGGPSGWIGRGFVTQMMGENLPVGHTNEGSFGTELERIKFKRREATSGEVVGGSGGSGVKYSTAELPVGASAPRSFGGEVSARDAALAAQSDTAREAFTDVYGAKDMVGTAEARQRYHGDPGPTKFWDREDHKKDTSGFQAGWNYLMDTEVMTSSFQLITVHEHKVMRDEVARYLLAQTQAFKTHASSHHVEDEQGEAIGEGALEEARVTAKQRYVEGEADDVRNRAADAMTGQIADAKRRVEKHTPQQLVRDLERLMSDFFAYADPASRVLAVIYIGIEEDDLDEALLSAFNMKAIIWAIGIAAGLAIVLWALSKLGPLGMLASAAIQKIVKKVGLSTDIATVLTIGQWAVASGATTSFPEAQRWAYIGADVSAELSELMRDFGVAAAREGLKFTKDWAFKPPSEDPSGLGKELGQSLRDDPAGREMLDEMEQAVRKSLDSGEGGLLTKDSIEFLKGADPEAYKRLARDYPQHFKDALKPAPELRAGSAAAEMHGLVQGGGVSSDVAGRVRVVEVPGSSVRVRADKGMLVVEVGKRARTDASGRAILEGHLGAIQRLSRYAGPVGRIRHWLAKLGAAIGFLTIHTKGGEADEEVKKLTEIKGKLEALRADAEGKLDKWAKRPDDLSDTDLDAEIKHIEDQLAKYKLELDSTSVGKGYIAAEGRSNFAAIEASGVLGKPLDKKALEKLGYRVDKNGVIYRPAGAGDTMEPLQVRNGNVEIADFESASAVQARVYESLPATRQADFDAMQAAAPARTKVRLVEGVHDTGATWKQVFGSPSSREGKALRAELKAILTKKGGLSGDKADELIAGLINRPETIKIVLGTDPVRTAHDYRSSGGTGDDEIAHHFDPLYLGGGHKLIANLPSGAHDDIHRFFDQLKLPNTASPRGASLQPASLQAKVRATAQPAVVVVQPDGSVSYRLEGEDWTL